MEGWGEKEGWGEMADGVRLIWTSGDTRGDTIYCGNRQGPRKVNKSILDAVCETGFCNGSLGTPEDP